MSFTFDDDALTNAMRQYAIDHNDVDDDDDMHDRIHHYALSMNENVAQYLRFVAHVDIQCVDDKLTIRVASHLNNDAPFRDDAQRDMFFEQTLSVVDAFTTLIACEYENDTTNCVSLWRAFDLGGDDDVDYNSSYINIVCNVLRVAYKQRYAK